MKYSIGQLEVKLNEIASLIGDEKYEEATQEYLKIENNIMQNRYIMSETDEYNKEVFADLYASYSYYLFNSSNYDKFFEMYVNAQNYGYPSEKRRKFLYEAFIEPNVTELKNNYKKNFEKMKNMGSIEDTVLFEELPYWVITTGNEDEYYLYEKKSDLIREKFRFELSVVPEVNMELSFEKKDCLILSSGCWTEIQTYVKDFCLEGMKAYIIENNILELLSFFQSGIINEFYFSKMIIFKSKNDFKSYFLKYGRYLPKEIIGSCDEKNDINKVIEEIHQHRLKKENRVGDNVLLSICIPSYNRGKRAYDNIIHTLNSDFDEEIEIILSNNGTKNESKEFYELIKKIEDSRLTYFEFDENKGFALNLCKTVDLAKGKYVLLLSDEDLVDLHKLRMIIDILKGKNIAIVRTKTDGQGIVPYIGITEPGTDSLYNFMLTSNYMPGIIFNKDLIIKYNLINYIKNNLDNATCYNYPHMVWELILCQYGNVLGLDVILINEGKAEKTEVEHKNIGEKENKTIPKYATIEERLSQHRGFFDIIREMEISKVNFDVYRELYKRLCAKTLFLVSLSIRVFYKHTDVNWNELLISAYNESLKYLDEMYKGRKSSNKYKYNEDFMLIKECYKNLKNQ